MSSLIIEENVKINNQTQRMEVPRFRGLTGLKCRSKPGIEDHKLKNYSSFGKVLSQVQYIGNMKALTNHQG